ncbi:hypothetical protein HZF02_16930 [Pseudomonas yamanorum]|nr:hypothetical protein HZF02_16930 [Pseudomonas yamanorum]
MYQVQSFQLHHTHRSELGVLLGLIQICNLLELSMKSEYRQAVESVIAQKAKLAEVAKLHADAAAREKQLSKALRFNQETLEQYERRVAELEPTNQDSDFPVFRDEIKEINASLKFLCRELMRS